MPARTEHSVAFQVPAALNASPLCENCLMLGLDAPLTESW